MLEHSKLIEMMIRNLGCIGPDGLTVALDRIVCLVGTNNAGKSTVLRAYELASTMGSKLDEADWCSHSPPGALPTVEFVMHIPKGMPNIGEEWIEQREGLRLLRSRWTWSAVGIAASRKTYHPVHKWEHEKKASGIDAVFSARLPQSLRVGSLDGPGAEERKLIQAVLEPIARELRRRQNEDPDLKKKLSDAFTAAEATVKELSNDLAKIELDLNRRLANVFPTVPISIRPRLGDHQLDLGALLTKNSQLQVQDQGKDLPTNRQGTGTQRALFWSLLSVRAGLERAIARRRAETDSKEKRAARAAKLPALINEAEVKEQTATATLKGAETVFAQATEKKKGAAQKKLEKAQQELMEIQESLGELQA